MFGRRKYKSTKYMTKEQKKKVFNNFKKVIEKRDINLMKKPLYEHLHLHCGFIAHFDINGFKATYNGQDFRRFVQHFDRKHPSFYGWSFWVNTDGYKDINNDMVDLVTAVAPKIYAELDLKVRNAEIRLLKVLAKKHSYKINKIEKVSA